MPSFIRTTYVDGSQDLWCAPCQDEARRLDTKHEPDVTQRQFFRAVHETILENDMRPTDRCCMCNRAPVSFRQAWT